MNPYWMTTAQRLGLIVLASAVYFPLVMRLIRRLDAVDKRYDVSLVASDPVANAIYAGVRELALILAGTWVFVEAMRTCLL